MPGILADSGGFISFLIYFVIAVFWVIGKVMQQRNARQRIQDLKRRREEREREEQRTGNYNRPPERRPESPPTRPPPAPAPAHKSLEDELQEFLGRLAGIEPEPPKPEPKPKPLITFDSAPPPRVVHQEAPPPPRPPPRTAYTKPPAKRGDEDFDAMAAYAKINDIEDIKELELDPDKASFGGPDVLLNVRAMLIDLSSISVRIPTIHIPTLRTAHSKTTPPDVGSLDALKQAILSGILLGPPKALQADPFQNEPGQL